MTHQKSNENLEDLLKY